MIERGYVAGVMGFGGEGVEASSAAVDEAHVDTERKGASLADALRTGLTSPAKVIVLLYDPLCGSEHAAAARRDRRGDRRPRDRGAAGQPWGPHVRTFTFHEDAIRSDGAVALALAGDFRVETGRSHGATITGITMEVTAASDNHLLELSGRPALEVWSEMLGATAQAHGDDTAAWGIGFREEGDTEDDWNIMGAFSLTVTADRSFFRLPFPSAPR